MNRLIESSNKAFYNQCEKAPQYDFNHLFRLFSHIFRYKNQQILLTVCYILRPV